MWHASSAVPCGSKKSCCLRGAARLHTALCESIWKRCGPIVWRGSTRVLEAREGLESRGSSVGRALFAWRRDYERRGPCRPCAGLTHVARGLAAPRGSIPSGSDVAQSLCAAGPRRSTRVHAGSRRSGRVYIIESCSFASCTTQGPRGSRAGRQCCLRGGKAITGVGHAGSAQFPRVPRRSRGPRGLAGPFHQEAMWPKV